jgi:hypothetical protein
MSKCAEMGGERAEVQGDSRLATAAAYEVPGRTEAQSDGRHEQRPCDWRRTRIAILQDPAAQACKRPDVPCFRDGIGCDGSSIQRTSNNGTPRMDQARRIRADGRQPGRERLERPKAAGDDQINVSVRRKTTKKIKTDGGPPTTTALAPRPLGRRERVRWWRNCCGLGFVAGECRASLCQPAEMGWASGRVGGGFSPAAPCWWGRRQWANGWAMELETWNVRPPLPARARGSAAGISSSWPVKRLTGKTEERSVQLGVSLQPRTEHLGGMGRHLLWGSIAFQVACAEFPS